MIAAPLPVDEPDRLRRLLGLGVLDASRDPTLDALAHRTLLLFPGADSAVISFVAANRIWFKASAGRVWPQVPRSHSFSAHAILEDRILVVEDAWRDERFTDHPAVMSEPGIRFFASAPLVDRVGALSVIGLHPRLMTKIAIATLTTLAQTVSQRLALHRAIRDLTRQIPLTGGSTRDGRLTREALAGLNDRHGRELALDS